MNTETMKDTYKALFEPYTLPSGVELKNRIIMAPMTNYASDDEGNVTEEELAYYRERSAGTGTVITAVAYITPGGKGFPGEVSAHSDDMIPSLRRLAATIKGEGAKAILQIFHAGRMAPPELLPDGQPVSASAVKANRPGLVEPRELTEEEIETIIQEFGDATRRAIEAGFDGVEIHGANTYLIQQFFSPHSNCRTDKWGGTTIPHRAAFPLAVIDRVNAATEEHADDPFIVGYRLSPEEIEEPGITMEDTLQLVDTLAKQKLDYLHVSVQNFWGGSIRDEEDTESRVVKIQERVGDQLPIIGVGSIHTPDEALKALDTGVPLLALGRELIMEPKWVQKVQYGEEETIRTTLNPGDQDELVVPNTLWDRILSVKGWFPVEEDK